MPVIVQGCPYRKISSVDRHMVRNSHLSYRQYRLKWPTFQNRFAIIPLHIYNLLFCKKNIKWALLLKNQSKSFICLQNMIMHTSSWLHGVFIWFSVFYFWSNWSKGVKKRERCNSRWFSRFPAKCFCLYREDIQRLQGIDFLHVDHLIVSDLHHCLKVP